MNSGLIASRYATAFFAFVTERKEQELVYNEAKKLKEIYQQLSEFPTILQNPVLVKAEKKKVILMALGGKVSESLEKFIDMLLKNNRETYLQSIVLKIIELYRAEKNIHYGKLTTASIVDPEIEKKLILMVEQETGGTVEMEKVLDAEIIGGFLFEVDFKRWDASIKRQLNSIRKEYTERNLKTI